MKRALVDAKDPTVGSMSVRQFQKFANDRARQRAETNGTRKCRFSAKSIDLLAQLSMSYTSKLMGIAASIAKERSGKEGNLSLLMEHITVLERDVDVAANFLNLPLLDEVMKMKSSKPLCPLLEVGDDELHPDVNEEKKQVHEFLLAESVEV